MTYSILVALDGSAWADGATETALWIASRALARGGTVRVEGLHVVNVTQVRGAWTRDLAGMLGFEPVVVPEKVEAHFVQRGQALLARFEARATELGVPCTTRLLQGGVVDSLVHRGDLHDLVVMGVRGETEEEFSGQGGGTAERVLRRLGTTALVVPASQRDISGIALGYDGSDGAARALRAVAHLAEIAQISVRAVHVSDATPKGDPLDDVAAHFASSGIDVQTLRATGEAHEVLPAESVRLGCNVLALGFRGRSQLKDVFLGRTVEWLVGRVSLAVLVAR